VPSSEEVAIHFVSMWKAMPRREWDSREWVKGGCVCVSIQEYSEGVWYLLRWRCGHRRRGLDWGFGRDSRRDGRVDFRLLRGNVYLVK
jgi:hypothetical protein